MALGSNRISSVSMYGLLDLFHNNPRCVQEIVPRPPNDYVVELNDVMFPESAHLWSARAFLTGWTT